MKKAVVENKTSMRLHCPFFLRNKSLKPFEVRELSGVELEIFKHNVFNSTYRSIFNRYVNTGSIVFREVLEDKPVKDKVKVKESVEVKDKVIEDSKIKEVKESVEVKDSKVEEVKEEHVKTEEVKPKKDKKSKSKKQ